MLTMLATAVYIGCYTTAESPLGLRLAEVDGTTGEIRLVSGQAEENPIYMAEGGGGILYVNSGDGLASYRMDGNRFVFVDRISLGGQAVCHVSLSADGRRAYWAAYSNGCCGSVEVDAGRFGKAVTHHHTGRGTNLPRQSGPHPHFATPTPDGAGYAVVDLGLDRIVTYRGADETAVAFETAPRGAGPRHFVYHPAARRAYVLFELGDVVAAYRTDATGAFGELINELPTTVACAKVGDERNGTAAAIRLTPDGRGVVVSNRAEHSLVVFDIDPATGALAFRARTVLPGDWPRDFAFLSETLALAAMERSGEVHALKFDAASGRFTVLSTCGGLHRPVAILKRRKL